MVSPLRDRFKGWRRISPADRLCARKQPRAIVNATVIGGCSRGHVAAGGAPDERFGVQPGRTRGVGTMGRGISMDGVTSLEPFGGKRGTTRVSDGQRAVARGAPPYWVHPLPAEGAHGHQNHREGGKMAPARLLGLVDEARDAQRVRRDPVRDQPRNLHHSEPGALADFVEEHKAIHVATLASSARPKYLNTLKNHILPAFGPLRLCDLGEDLQAFINQKNYSVNSHDGRRDGPDPRNWRVPHPARSPPRVRAAGLGPGIFRAW